MIICIISRLSYVCKLCTCTGMRLANDEKESPVMFMHVYTIIVLYTRI